MHSSSKSRVSVSLGFAFVVAGCRCLIDGTSEEGSSRGGEEVGAIGRRILGTVVRDLPSFRTPARRQGLLLLVSKTGSISLATIVFKVFILICSMGFLIFGSNHPCLKSGNRVKSSLLSIMPY